MDSDSMSMDVDDQGETTAPADNTAKVVKYHSNIRCPNACFRQKHTGPWEGTDAEYCRVIKEGGAGITVPMSLCPNLAGTQELILHPMQPGEELYVMNPGQSQANHTLGARAAKFLAQHPGTGKRDISTKYWLDDSGKSLPAFPNEIKGEIFSDNITCYAKDKLDIIEFLKPAGIHFHAEKRDPERAASIVPCQEKKDSKGRAKYKISLAGLPIDGIEFIHYVKAEADAWHSGPEGLNFDKLQEFMHRESRFFNGSGAFLQLDNVSELQCRLTAMITAAAKLDWCDTDLTIDIPGTLHSDNMNVNVEAVGLKVEDHKCGHNMVRLKAIQVQLESGKTMVAHVKAYNKFAETLEQGAARNQDIACKCAYALCPSTNRLKDAFWNPAYYLNGITRFEVTFSAVPDAKGVRAMLPVKEMARFIEKHLFLLDGALVTCSFDDHLRRMESLVERSLIVYYPDQLKMKRDEYTRKKKPQNKGYNASVKKTLDKNSDAFLIRWYNGKTGKMNGIALHADFSGRSRSDSDCAFGKVAEVAAWCSSCGANPYLLVCVRGMNEDPFPSGPNARKPVRNLYFRKFELQRTVAGVPIDVEHPQPEALTYFAGKGMHGKGLPVRCAYTDFNRIGVDVSTHTNIRPAVLDKLIEPNYYTMGQLDIVILSPIITTKSQALNGSFSALTYNQGEDTATTSSEGRRQIAGIPVTTLKVDSMTDVPMPVSKWQEKGQQGRPRGNSECPKKLFIWLGSVHRDKYEVPALHARALVAEFRKDPYANIWVSYNPKDGFRWELKSAGDDQQVMRDNIKVGAISNLPVTQTLQTIRNAEFCPGKKGSETLSITMETGSKFYLPKSIREWLVAQYGRSNVIENVRGMRISHPLRRTVRVAGQANEEEALAIFAADDDTDVLYSNFQSLTGAKRPGHTAASVGPAMKKQRHV